MPAALGQLIGAALADDRTPAQRAETMRRVKGSNTSCEVRLRSALHRRGLRYSLRKQLPGKPDIVFVRAKVAVFVDGCFWHGCPQHCRRPSSNTTYWHAKIDRNMARDERIAKELRAQGWRVIRVWEHDVKEHLNRSAARIERSVRARLDRT